MAPKPLYYRLRRWDQRPGAGGTADGQLTLEGHSVKAVDGYTKRLAEARDILHIPNLSDQGLRKLTPSDRPDSETEVGLKLQKFEAEGRIEIVHNQASIE
jgi:hypothetical protein